MDKLNEKLKSDFGIFLYKILGDIMILLLLSLALLLLSEGIMPGLVSSFLSFTRLILIIFAVLGGIIYLGKLNEISFDLENKKTVFLGGFLVFSVMLIVNSILKFSLIEIGIITIASIFLLFYLYRNYLTESEISKV